MMSSWNECDRKWLQELQREFLKTIGVSKYNFVEFKDCDIEEARPESRKQHVDPFIGDGASEVRHVLASQFVEATDEWNQLRSQSLPIPHT